MRGAWWQRGQASVEVVALLPAVVLLVLAAVWAVALLNGTAAAQDDAWRRATAARGDGGHAAMQVVTGVATTPGVPAVGWGSGRATVTAGVRAP